MDVAKYQSFFFLLVKYQSKQLKKLIGDGTNELRKKIFRFLTSLEQQANLENLQIP